MSEIKFAIEGSAALDATEALLEIEGIDGVIEAIDGAFAENEELEREPLLTTIASVVGIVSGALAVAEQIRKWYQEYRAGKSGKKIVKVLIVGRKGDRLLLENATIEQIRKVLES